MSTDDPFKERISKAIMRNPYTMDLPELLQWDGHFVFMYGTLKHDHSRHGMIKAQGGTRFQGLAITSGDNYEMVNTTFGFPVVFEDTGAKDRLGYIKGELYFVPTDLIPTIDSLESNTRMYQRKRVNVRVIRYQNEGPEELEAYMYIGRNEFWRQYMEQIRDMEYRNEKIGRYYIYTKQDAEKYAFRHDKVQ